ANETDGSLGSSRRFSTGGRGSGGTADPLASQGSLTLTEDHSFWLALKAGREISVFRVHQALLELVDVTPRDGSEPVAVAQQGNLVYVVNAGGSSNVVAILNTSRVVSVRVVRHPVGVRGHCDLEKCRTVGVRTVRSPNVSFFTGP